jgi:hypothetical protein
MMIDSGCRIDKSNHSAANLSPNNDVPVGAFDERTFDW